VKDSNSAAQVSTRRKTVRMPAALRSRVDVGRGEAGRVGDLAVGEAGLLGLTEQYRRETDLPAALSAMLEVDDLRELAQEPRVDLGELEDLLSVRPTPASRSGRRSGRSGFGRARRARDLGEVGEGGVAVLAAAAEAPGADLERTEAPGRTP
jgi:hypothetical protein